MTKRKPPRIKDETLLGFLKRGVVRVWRSNRRTPTILCRGRRIAISRTSGRTGDRPRVQFYLNGRKRTVLVHKLVWMKIHGRTVPPGYQIHHRDGDRFNNRAGNLELVTAEDHYQLGKYNAEPF